MGARQVFSVGPLEQAARSVFQFWVVVLDGEEPVRRWAFTVKRRAVDVAAMRAGALVALDDPFGGKRCPAVARTGMFWVCNFVQVAA